MRKVFLFLATAALFASCSDDLLEPNNGSQATNSKGITFTVVDDAATRGMIDADRNAFFFAERDRINIWSSNAQKNWTAPNTWDVLSTTWDGAGHMATYKATSSTGNPHFTAISDADMLGFKDYNSASGHTNDNLAKFFIAYPTGQAVSYSAPYGVATFTITPNVDLSTQDMNMVNSALRDDEAIAPEGYNNIDKRLMYDYAKAQKKDGAAGTNESVGEKVDMSFTSPLSTMFFSCTDLDDYEGTLGALQSITFSSEYSPLVPNATTNASYTVDAEDLVTVDGKQYLYGDVEPKEFNTNGTVKSYKLKAGVTAEKAITAAINLKSDQFKYTVDGSGTEAVDFAPATSFAVRSATLNVNGNIEQGQEMSLFVLPAKHSVNKPEVYTIAYTFMNVDLTYTRNVTSDFTSNGGWTPFRLTIAKEFPYLLTKGAGGNARTLIVNSGSLKDIFDANGKVKWTDSFTEGGVVPVANITKVIIGSDVEDFVDADWTKLNTLTATTELTINNLSGKELKNVKNLDNLTSLKAPYVTSVAKDAFDSGVATGLQILDLRSVSSEFKTQTGVTFNALTYLNLAAYNFQTGDPDQEISPEVFFNSNTKSHLETVDLSAVTSLAPVFGYERNILFTNYTALETIKLNPNGTIISSNEFMGCTSLETVNGAVKFSTATGAFQGCTVLDSVFVQSPEAGKMVIPANAFSTSGVKFVIDNATKKQVVPTSIGANAFQGNTAIDKIDLTKASTIGESAFHGAAAFEGVGTNHVVTLVVEEVKANTFNGTIIQRFQLINATKIGNLSLNANTANLKQIKFMKKLDAVAFNTPVENATKPNVNIFIYDADDASLFPVGTGSGYYKSCTQELTPWPWQSEE